VLGQSHAVVHTDSFSPLVIDVSPDPSDQLVSTDAASRRSRTRRLGIITRRYRIHRPCRSVRPVCGCEHQGAPAAHTVFRRPACSSRRWIGRSARDGCSVAGAWRAGATRHSDGLAAFSAIGTHAYHQCRPSGAPEVFGGAGRLRGRRHGGRLRAARIASLPRGPCQPTEVGRVPRTSDTSTVGGAQCGGLVSPGP